MWKKLLGTLWRGAPKRVRRWSVWLAEPRFMVTVGAIVLDEGGRVLLLQHEFRTGSGWGIPGGFLERGEQPLEALRRELREEVGIELDAAELVRVRTLSRPQQVEIHFRCRMRAGARAEPRSMEINSVGWFEATALPPELSRDQRRIIADALAGGANPAE
ncbi:MAG: NUDIX domain-containing protein [Acidobacteria bacterium]|nr:NUDIX domain-containing protein [Acidobacteriota bacterium]